MPSPTVEEFRATVRAWLDANAERSGDDDSFVWGQGELPVSFFRERTDEEEQAHLDAVGAWEQTKAEAGFHAPTWPTELGGLGLSNQHALTYAEIEAEYATPGRHELLSVTTGMVAPTIQSDGNDEQRERFVERFLRCHEWCCQLFSEPAAGSDLASVACKAVRDGDEWIINGQKVWTSGASFAQWGFLIARTDPSVPKHKGLTAFLVPMDADGIDVVPIRQMSGGSSFSEVFFTDAHIADELRIGDVGAGWGVALTMLAHERGNSSRRGARKRPGGSAAEAIATAEAFGATDDPVIRQKLAQAYIREQVRLLTAQRVSAAQGAGGKPGPEGSIGKLFWVDGLPAITDVVSQILGPRLLADSGEWGTFEWNEHVTGAPGYRIAGGSDEIQRNIIGERVLGLPPEPRVDKNIPFNQQ